MSNLLYSNTIRHSSKFNVLKFKSRKVLLLKFNFQYLTLFMNSQSSHLLSLHSTHSHKHSSTHVNSIEDQISLLISQDLNPFFMPNHSMFIFWNLEYLGQPYSPTAEESGLSFLKSFYNKSTLFNAGQYFLHLLKCTLLGASLIRICRVLQKLMNDPVGILSEGELEDGFSFTIARTGLSQER